MELTSMDILTRVTKIKGHSMHILKVSGHIDTSDIVQREFIKSVKNFTLPLTWRKYSKNLTEINRTLFQMNDTNYRGAMCQEIFLRGKMPETL